MLLLYGKQLVLSSGKCIFRDIFSLPFLPLNPCPTLPYRRPCLFAIKSRTAAFALAGTRLPALLSDLGQVLSYRIVHATILGKPLAVVKHNRSLQVVSATQTSDFQVAAPSLGLPSTLVRFIFTT
jgi:hypothetical protein